MPLQVIADAAVFTSWIVAEILFEALAHPGSQLNAGVFVERFQDDGLVAVQLMEADVDTALGRHQFPIPHPRTEQAVYPVGPVVDQPVRIDAAAAQPIRVGHHRDRRLDDGDRIAVGECDRSVGEGVHQRPKLLGMLRGLQHPGLRTPEEGQRLQHFLHVGVVLGLVECQVGVAPTRHAGQPFQDVAGEIQIEEFDLFLDRLGKLVVHGRHQRHVGQHGIVFSPGAGVARIDPEHIGSAAAGRDGFLTLPVRQRPPTPVSRKQIHQVRGSRSRHTNHDDRLLDLDRLDLRVAPDQIRK